MVTAEPVARLIDEFHKLPGIGPKTAQRLAYYLLRMPEAQARALANAIIEVKEKIGLCSVCFNITDIDPCGICASADRNPGQICVVEEPLDVLAIEKTRQFRGRYHVLHGAISPLEGVGPDDLKIEELVARVRAGGIEEVILATNPNQLGEATAYYIQGKLKPLGVRLTRLAHGLPMGGNLEYADEVTLSRAVANRQELS
ncbi:MAG: recombination mediator RecR [Chloroflexota bacterium]|nr:recombination mediator RecR [Dehalococcoidia bacterium]MDW8252772.1 recombination mediator RecR [Chloroflexota bacterium]